MAEGTVAATATTDATANATATNPSLAHSPALKPALKEPRRRPPPLPLRPEFFSSTPAPILTVGDGDLSFSLALARAADCGPRLTATVYDSRDTLVRKYPDAEGRIAGLQQLGAKVFFGIDARKLSSSPINDIIVPGDKFGIIAFQFPLLPVMNKQEFQTASCKDPVLNNRLMLLEFLLEAKNLLLENGLAVITSKDVRPYTLWRLHDTLAPNIPEIDFLGKVPFSVADYPGYNCQNVERDAQVKDTEGQSYLFGFEKAWDEAEASSPAKETANLEKAAAGGGTTPAPGGIEAGASSEELRRKVVLSADPCFRENACNACGTGPFTCDRDRQQHLSSKGHGRFVGGDGIFAEQVERVRKERKLSEQGPRRGAGGEEEVVAEAGVVLGSEVETSAKRRKVEEALMLG